MQMGIADIVYFTDPATPARVSTCDPGLAGQLSSRQNAEDAVQAQS